MKINFLINVTIILLVTLFISSCSKEENSVNPPTSGNYLINTSFEKNGFFSAEGWTLPLQSDSSTDVPPNGGKYSLLLQASWGLELYAEIKIPVLTQYNDYKLSFWSRSTGITNGVYGRAILSLWRNGSVIKSQSTTVDDNTWRSYSIIDTFSVTQGDSFLVQLSGGTSQLLPGNTYFDLCTLEAVE
jgi:hypothetical protein